MECNTNIASVVLYSVLYANYAFDKILSLLLHAVNRLFNIYYILMQYLRVQSNIFCAKLTFFTR